MMPLKPMGGEGLGWVRPEAAVPIESHAHKEATSREILSSGVLGASFSKELLE